MSRPKNPIRLILQPDRYKNGSLTHKAQWYFRYNGKPVFTGCGQDDVSEAETFLASFLQQKHVEALSDGSQLNIPHRMYLVTNALQVYAVAKVAAYVGKDRQRKEFLRRLEKLTDWWAHKSIAEINVLTCEQYSKGRSASMAARELDDLKAAVRYLMDRAIIEKKDVAFSKGAESKARIGYFTRSQAAKFIWYAYRYRAPYTYTSKRSKERVGETVLTDRYPLRHLIPFFLMGVYTGTRSTRILRASYVKKPGHPWVDLKSGIYYRAAEGEQVPNNKRAGPMMVPRRLLAHMRRWHSMGAEYVCSYNGKVIENNFKAFKMVVKKALKGDDLTDLNRHAMKHTCATWLMMAGTDIDKVAGYLSTTREIIIAHYGKFHPQIGREIDESFSSGKAGREVDVLAVKKVVAKAINSNERRALLLDMADMADAPNAVVDLIHNWPDDDLTGLRKKLKAGKLTGDWATVFGLAKAA